MDAPWSNKETLSISDRLARLSKEIVDFEKYIGPTKEEQLNRDTLLYSISQLVESLWPNNNTITAFGSSVTGLQFPSSDVDINIDFDQMPKNNRIDILKVIRKAATRTNLFTFGNTTLAANAKVPVLMATDENDISMDITVQNECFSSDRTAAWIKEYPALKPLFMVLKQAIGNYRVSNMPAFEPLSAKTAGLASYSLVCLIVSYLQLIVSDDFKPTDPTYYAIILIGFLDHYSKFDNTHTAIGLSDGGEYYTKNDCPIKFESKAGKIHIVDPDQPDVNVGRSTLKFDIIKLIFKYAHDQLMKRIVPSGETESILSSIVKVEHHYHKEPRRQGTRFKTEKTWIENGAPVEKNNGFGRNRFGGKRRGGANKPYEIQQARSHQRFDQEERGARYGGRDDTTYSSRPMYHDNITIGNGKSRYKGGYKRNYDDNDGRYRSAPYGNSLDSNEREYQRHKKNNNHHLAEHYRSKTERSYSNSSSSSKRR